MKINRWISVPLSFAVSYPLLMSISSSIFGLPINLAAIIVWVIGGFLMAVVILFWGDLRTRKFSKNNAEKDFSVIQNQKVMFLMGNKRLLIYGKSIQ